MTGNNMSKPIVYNEMDDVELDYDPRIDLRSEANIRTLLAFDIAPDAMLVDKPEVLGLHRSSQDVFEAEMHASQQRRNNMGSVLPFLMVLTRLTSEVQNAVIVEVAEDKAAAQVTTANHVLSASIGILSTLLDLGIVTLTDPSLGAVDA